jgi:hypothetical protein
MRQSLFLFIWFSCTIAGFAQFTKGDRMVGSSVSSIVYNSGSSDITVSQVGNSKSTNNNYNIMINPSMGWFLSDKTVVGALLNVNPTGSKVTFEERGSTFQSDKTNSFNIGLGGFIRHYLNTSGSLYPFGQFGFNVGISSLKTEGFFYYNPSAALYKHTYSGSSSGGFFANASIQGGVSKMVGETAALDFFLGYNYGYNKNTFTRTTLYYLSSTDTSPTTGTNETTTKFTNHGFLLGVGFQVFLRKKK